MGSQASSLSDLELRPEPGQPVETLDTPAVLVDLERLERNVERWQAAIDAAGPAFRVHVKTHKTPELALRQLASGAKGVACAKVGEAEVFAAAGCDDVVVAYPVVGREKWRRLGTLAARGVRIAVACESELAARGLSAEVAALDAEVGVQVEIDTGLHRCGFEPSRYDEIDGLCRLVATLPGLRLEGVTTYRGVFFEHTGSMTKEDAGHEEGRILVELAARLRADGHEIREVTAGSTPTGLAVAEVPGITEVRAGTYVFNDLMQLDLGSAGPDDLALTALCTVVSHSSAERATVDGGSKTFSGDSVLRADGGSVFGRAAEGDLVLERLTEEHGMARVESPGVRIGEKRRFYPVHACTVVNLSDQLVGVRGDRVETVWTVLARGKRT